LAAKRRRKRKKKEAKKWGQKDENAERLRKQRNAEFF